jgi:hypothetical protein
MDESLFKIYQQQLSDEGLDPNSNASRDWFLDKMDEITNLDVDRNAMKAKQKVASKFFIGKMYMFWYKPKLRIQLPYYDRFPLVILLDITKEGFLGLNLHYLPIDLRQKLYYTLLPRATTTEFGAVTRLKIDYKYLLGKTALRAYKPCVKQYLFKQVTGRMAFVPANEWEVAVHMPTAYFKKATESKVHKESRIIARKNQ